MSVKEKMSALADEIRAKGGGEEPLSIDKMREKIQSVYDSGKKEEYDRFWDEYQNYGKRGNYNYAFYGGGWTDQNFKPKYDICPKNSGSTVTMMFAGSAITDLAKILEECKVKLDLSYFMNNSLVNLFRESKVIRLPEINVVNSGGFGEYCFYKCSDLVTIEKLIVREGQIFSENTFNGCTSLKNIIIDGTVSSNLDIHWSPLSKESILSIFNALSGSAMEKNVSFSLAAVNKAFENTENAGDGSISDEWKSLLNTKSNWTVTLI